jgi:hypothetical protein
LGVSLTILSFQFEESITSTVVADPSPVMSSATTTTTDSNPAFVLRAVKDVAFETRPVPTLRDAHEVRVHVAQTGS